MNLLFYHLGTDDRRIEYRILFGMHEKMQKTQDLNSNFITHSRFSLNFLSKLITSDFLIVGSPIFKVFWLIFLCWIFRIQVIYVMWDCYPVRILNRPFGNKIKVAYQYITEYIGSKIISASIIPTTDFKDFVQSKKWIVVPFWPQDSVASTSACRERKQSSNIKFVFSGQVNQTRGLEECILQLKDSCDFDFSLTIASPSNCPVFVEKYDFVDFVGHLTPIELKALYANVDVALVSLHPDLQTPGFPSKTFEYVGAGLAIIYFGPALYAYEKIVSTHLGGIILSQQTEPIRISEIFDRYTERNLVNFRDAVTFTDSSKASLLDLLRSLSKGTT